MTTKPNIQPDDLFAAVNREVILLAGESGGGKSFTVAKLCEQGLEEGFNVVVVDRDRGLAKAVMEVFGELPENLDYFLADSWDKIPAAVDHAFRTLTAEDWLVIEMAGGIWDFAQSEYTRMVYGEALSDMLVHLRADAQASLTAQGIDPKSKEGRAEIGRAVGYSGLEGRTDWNYIKRMHNDHIYMRAIINGKFNILTTTSMKSVSKEDKEADRHSMWHTVQVRPEGEKTLVYRHDTIAMCYQKNGKYYWRTDMGGRGKDRGGRTLYRDVDFTGDGFVHSYLTKHGLRGGTK